MPYKPQNPTRRRNPEINKWKDDNPKRPPNETWHTRASKTIYLVMHQMMPHPREEEMEAINQLALTFGTLLSSQRSNAHPQKPLDLLGGNLINATRSDSRCQTARPGPADLTEASSAPTCYQVRVKGVAALASRAQLATPETLPTGGGEVKSVRSCHWVPGLTVYTA
jgi:hypothetical protein